MDTSTAVLTFLGVILGGVITFFVSRHYYVKSAKDLIKESTGLRRKTDLILISLQNAGLVELARDNTGEISGINVTIQVPSATQTQHVDNPTFTYHPPVEKI